MENTNHFILTRFNIRLWTKDKTNRPTQTPEWLKERFRLFEQYCLPSVKNQDCKNFKWIVLFDAETPDLYKKKITDYQSQFEPFIPCFVSAEDAQNFVLIFQEEIKKHLDKTNNKIITTYLDNDDAIRYDYISEIQKVSARTSPKTFISFTYGLQYFTQLNIATNIRYENNHFISFVEDCSDNSNIKTVQGYGSHYYINQYKETKILYIHQPEKEKWIEIIHGSNVDNDIKMTFKTKLITDKNKLRKEYGIDVTLAKNSTILFFTKYMQRLFMQVLRRTKYKFVKRKWD
ncbi:MAG: putative rhamnosyl transferase [Bacteroidales bacterium]|nr:putative rhamnosyl transferase [Bacteroidales bacterium]